MHLRTSLEKVYSSDQLSAREAQRLAEYIAWAPAIFQSQRIMKKWGILNLIRNSMDGLTLKEICAATNRSEHAVKCLMEASLAAGSVMVEKDTERYTLTKTGWFLETDAATCVNFDFNHDVNYRAWYHLEEALESGKPEGLKIFGEWPTVYEGLSQLPEQAQRSWFKFDHFYSDASFNEALELIFDRRKVRTLYDVGGNTGKWALRCVEFNPEVRVTVLDLPQQVALMKGNIKGKKGADRISGYGFNLLDKESAFPAPAEGGLDAIWMSQFLDCFSMREIVSILSHTAKVMGPETELYIMEPLWDRQKYEPAALTLVMTSLYFTAVANGNSKMYNTEDMTFCVEQAGLKVESIKDDLGYGHSILVCKLK